MGILWSKIQRTLRALRNDIQKQRPVELNILLFGPTGVGKSSFANACETAMKDMEKVSSLFSTGQGQESHTIGFQKTKYGYVRLIDMQGAEDGLRNERLTEIISGKNIAFKKELDNDLMPIDGKKTGDITIHCVVIFLRSGMELQGDLERMVAQVIKQRRLGNVAVHVVVTFLDKVDKKYKNPDHLPGLNNCDLVKETLRKHTAATGLERKHFSIVRNYIDDEKPNNNMNILILKTLTSIVFSAEEQYGRQTRDREDNNCL